MLKQGSVSQIRHKEIPRENSLIVIAMCFYPRGIKKEWRDTYINALAPARELFTEWKAYEKKSGHDEAFRLSHYEERFSLTPFALNHLKIYSEDSGKMDIYLICQCEVGSRCHREMLLLTAKKRYGATIAPLFHTYPVFEKRIPILGDKS